MAEKTGFCVTTVVTADHFQHYIPIFVYTLKRAVPDVDILVHINGEIDSITKEALSACDLTGSVRFVQLDYSHKAHVSTFNSLRFCAFVDYEYAYITDIDFVFLPHEPSFDKYYKRKLERWGQPYWGMRGPKKNKLKRIRGGVFLVTQEWWEKTKVIRNRMLDHIICGDIGKVREDDETMLWQICAKSGMKLPTKKGNKRKAKYREIHLGDFKFPTRWTNMSKMADKITKSNMFKWFQLQKEPTWLKVREICEQDEEIKMILANVDTYMKTRKTNLI